MELNGYELSRDWFDWAFENHEKLSAAHTAMYMLIIERNNRLGWKENFGFPMEWAKEVLGIKNYRTYKKVFDDLVNFGFIKIVQESKNQYTSTIIAIVKNAKPTTNALDKAIQNHLQNQSQKQYNDSVCIDKQVNHKPLNHKQTNQTEEGENFSLDAKSTPSHTNKGRGAGRAAAELNFPYKSEEFMKYWDIIKNESKWKKKSHNALQESLNQLGKHSEQDAIQMMKNSISAGWQGLFELKKNGSLFHQEEPTVARRKI